MGYIVRCGNQFICHLTLICQHVLDLVLSTAHQTAIVIWIRIQIHTPPSCHRDLDLGGCPYHLSYAGHLCTLTCSCHCAAIRSVTTLSGAVPHRPRPLLDPRGGPRQSSQVRRR